MMNLDSLNITTGVRKARTRRHSFSTFVTYFKAGHDESLFLSRKRVSEHSIDSPQRNKRRALETSDMTGKKKARQQQTSEQQRAKQPLESAGGKRICVQQTSKRQASKQELFTACCKKVHEQQTSEQRAAKVASAATRRKKSRAQLTAEQRAVQRELDSVRRRKARERKTPEQLAAERAQTRARRRRHRERQTSEQRAAERALNTARRREARARLKKACEGKLEELRNDAISGDIPHACENIVKDHSVKLPTISLQEGDYEGPLELEHEKKPSIYQSEMTNDKAEGINFVIAAFHMLGQPQEFP